MDALLLKKAHSVIAWVYVEGPQSGAHMAAPSTALLFSKVHASSGGEALLLK